MTDRVSDAWRRAATDLGIDVVAPYEVVDETTGVSARALAFVPRFGSQAGTLVISSAASNLGCSTWARDRGAFLSIVNEGAYADYDREVFVDTLNDWGWFGDAQRAPAWFTGRPWTA